MDVPPKDTLPQVCPHDRHLACRADVWASSHIPDHAARWSSGPGVGTGGRAAPGPRYRHALQPRAPCPAPCGAPLREPARSLDRREIIAKTRDNGLCTRWGGLPSNTGNHPSSRVSAPAGTSNARRGRPDPLPIGLGAGRDGELPRPLLGRTQHERKEGRPSPTSLRRGTMSPTTPGSGSSSPTTPRRSPTTPNVTGTSAASPKTPAPRQRPPDSSEATRPGRRVAPGPPGACRRPSA